jgi:hypothetical protein
MAAFWAQRIDPTAKRPKSPKIANAVAIDVDLLFRIMLNLVTFDATGGSPTSVDVLSRRTIQRLQRLNVAQTFEGRLELVDGKIVLDGNTHAGRPAASRFDNEALPLARQMLEFRHFAYGLLLEWANQFDGWVFLAVPGISPFGSVPLTIDLRVSDRVGRSRVIGYYKDSSIVARRNRLEPARGVALPNSAHQQTVDTDALSEFQVRQATFRVMRARSFLRFPDVPPRPPR